MSRLIVAALAAVLALPSAALAQKPEEKPAVAPLGTRAQIRTLTQDSKGQTLIALKVVPRAKLPFSTLTFLVRDPALVSGFAVGDDVFFVGARVDGENTLQSLKKTTPCSKFQDCKPHDAPPSGG